MKNLAFIVTIAFFLESCTYAISPDLASRAEKKIPFEMLQNDPESYKGKLIILGGVIVGATNIDHAGLIEVSQKSLDRWGKPERTDKSGGRFIILYKGYLDPLAYTAGRTITVAGEVEGTQRKSLENGSLYPVLLSKEIRLWPQDRPSLYRPDYMDPLRYDPNNPGSVRQY